jgi:dipeptidyl aminopeptidase/acylaminoacyl peptidase
MPPPLPTPPCTGSSSSHAPHARLELAVCALLGACHDPPDAQVVPPDPVGCADLTAPPPDAGTTADLCGHVGDSCFAPRASLAGSRELVLSVDWSPVDDDVLVGAIDDVRLVRVDRATDTLTTLAHAVDQAGRIEVDFAPDGRHALAVAVDVRLYRVDREPPALVELARVASPEGDLLSVKWSPDGRFAITTRRDGAVRLLAIDGDTLTPLATFTGHVGRAFSASWSPDGTRVLTGGEDGTARVLAVDAAAGSLVEVAALAHDVQVCPVAWSARGDALLGTWVPCPSTVELVTFGPSGSDAILPVAVLAEHASGMRVLAWSPDGSVAVAGGHDDTLRFLGRHDGSLRSLGLLPNGALGVHEASWSPDGTHLIVAASHEDRITLVDVRECLRCQDELEAR